MNKSAQGSGVQEPVIGQRIYGTSAYEVRVATIIEQQSGQELVVYGIFHNVTGVREAELRGYPHAIKWCDQLQEQVDQLFRERAQASSERSVIESALGPDNDDDAVEVPELPEALSPEEAKDELDSLTPSKEE